MIKNMLFNPQHVSNNPPTSILQHQSSIINWGSHRVGGSGRGQAGGSGRGRGVEPHLASQDMEVVGWRGAVDHLPVDLLGGPPQVPPREPLALIHSGGIVGVLISHLQEPLHPATAVLWPLQEI